MIAMKPVKQLKLRIEVDVLASHDGVFLSHLVNDVLAELVNRVDFKNGSINTGRAATHEFDFGSQVVTVDLFREVIDLKGPRP